jgi:hypothetical protein
MIGEKFKTQVQLAFGRLLEKHLEGIKDAYLKSESGISVSVPIKIQPNQKKSGFVCVEVGIRFTRLRTKDSILLEISELQDELIKAVDKLRPKKGSGIDRVTISNPQTGQTVSRKAKET